ncbi:hypothetical protein TrST_g13120 [Triparma strigata]|uniref:Uncharacterized protein n=1 Tax=Triparma strigata TaxID=1606541 RepID=A0A9W7B4N6_9STRA|nr:hypothetical protein TrST_g13120 [Triparma strigata]
MEKAAAVQMSVVVPAGVAPGGMFQLQTPDGQMMVVTCPPGAGPGQQIQIQVAVDSPPTVTSVAPALQLHPPPASVGMDIAPPQQAAAGGVPAGGGSLAALDAALDGAQVARLEFTAVGRNEREDSGAWSVALRLGAHSHAHAHAGAAQPLHPLLLLSGTPPAFVLTIESNKLSVGQYCAALWPAPASGSEPLVYFERASTDSNVQVMWGGLSWGWVQERGNITSDTVAKHGVVGGAQSLTLHTPANQAATWWWCCAFCCFFPTFGIAACIGSKLAAATPMKKELRAASEAGEKRGALPRTSATGYKLNFMNNSGLKANESSLALTLDGLSADQRRGALVAALAHVASFAAMATQTPG